jgi:hypothetical protein
MPKVACPPEQVYDKSKKKCVDIGSENYKNTLSKNPNAFKAYQKKIEKFLKKKTCKSGELYYKPTKRCVKVGGPTFKKYMKTNPNGFVTVSTKTPPKAKTPSPPPKTKTPHLLPQGQDSSSKDQDPTQGQDLLQRPRPHPKLWFPHHPKRNVKIMRSIMHLRKDASRLVGKRTRNT